MATAAAVERLVDELLDVTALLPVDECAVARERAVTRLQAAQADELIAGERSGGLADSGRRTVRTFATAILRRSQTDASQLALVAQHLADFPRLAAAYREGVAHTGSLRAVMANIKSCGLPVLQEYEEPLVLLATKAGPAEIYEFCRELADTASPDRDEAKVTAAGNRMVNIGRVGDLAHLDAMLDPALAAELKATLAAMAKASKTADDARSHAERSADALEEVLRSGMDAVEVGTQARRRRPTAMIRVDLDTLLGLPGHGRALLERFGMIPTGLAGRLCCDALARLVLMHGRQVLNVGREHRVVTDRQHAALAAIYSTCVMPGCGAPFADCDIHHVWWYSLGGPTDLDLQVPLCKSDHLRVHDHDYSITRENGVLTFRDPHGRLIGDPAQVLNEQLDLLRGEPDASPSSPVLQEAQSPYATGGWGWTGQDPHPSPGHDPPRPDDEGTLTEKCCYPGSSAGINLAAPPCAVVTKQDGWAKPRAPNARSTCRVTASTSPASTNANADPPNPAPVIRAPSAPASSAASTATSSSGLLTS